jgi:FkbM family methyltransferase
MNEIIRLKIDIEKFIKNNHYFLRVGKKIYKPNSHAYSKISLFSTLLGKVLKPIYRLLTILVHPMACRLRHFLFELVSSRLEKIEQTLKAELHMLERIELACRPSIMCGKDEILVKTRVGYVLCDAHDYQNLACLLDSGDLEIGTRLFIQKFLRAGDVFVDVGANIGIHTLAAAQALQGQGRIIAFEPFHKTKALLEKTVMMNGFAEIIEIHQAAVSNVTGSANLFIAECSGHNSLFALNCGTSVPEKFVEVQLLRLDDLITFGEKVSLLKIDAEGAELDVIEGALGLINSNPDLGLIVEFGPSHIRRCGRSASEWFAVFNKLGLRHFVINSFNGMLESFSEKELEEVQSVNLFFAREQSAAWQRIS